MIDIIITALVLLISACISFDIDYDKGYYKGKKEEHKRIDEILRGGKHDD